MKVQLILIVLALTAAYFFYVRDRYVHYPVEVSLADKENRNIEARVLWRNSQKVQFEKPGNSRLYFYEIDQLSYLSRIKLAFLPISKTKPVRYFEDANKDLQGIHADGIRAEMQKIQSKINAIDAKARLTRSIVDANTYEGQIENLEIKLNNLSERLATFQGSTVSKVGSADAP